MGRGLDVSLAMAAIATGLACSTNEITFDQMRPPDATFDQGADRVATAEGGAADAGADVRCTVPIDQIECALDLAGQRSQDRFCQPGRASCDSQIGPCGVYQVYWVGFAIGSLLCIYDQAGTRLLSATICTDVNVSCNGTSFCESGGADIDIAASCNLSTLPHPTAPPADGGAPDG